MRKFTGVALTLLLAATALSGCAGNSAGDKSAATGPAGLINPGTLTACIDPEYAPLEYYANGSDGDIVGFDADGIRALADHWGVEVKMVVTSFDGLMPGLQSSKCDMIFGGLYMSEARLAIADAAPVMQAGPAILAAPDKVSSLKKSSDLCGLTVAAQAASSNAASIHTLSDKCAADGGSAINVTEYPKTAETVLAVLNGKADALIETNVAASYMVAQNQGKLAVAPGIFPLDTTFGVFTRKDDTLSPAVADGLKALRENGTLAKIATANKLDPAIVDVK